MLCIFVIYVKGGNNEWLLKLKDNLRVIFFVLKCGVGKINLMIWFIGFFGL